MIKRDNPCEVYGANVTLFYSTFEEYAVHLHTLDSNIEINSDIVAEVRHLCINNEGVFYVWFSPTTTMPVLVHEAFHLVSFIFGFCQVQYDYYQHEAWAYYIEWWFKQFHSFIAHVSEVEKANKIKAGPLALPSLV